MSSDDSQPGSTLAQRRRQWLSDMPWERLAVWAIFLVVLCLLRRMLLILFLTFVVCYLARTIIGGLARRFWPNQQRRWLERILTVGFFAALFLVVAAVLHWLGPLVLDECQQLLARASNLDPDYDYDMFQKLRAAYAKGEAAFVAALGPPVVADDPAGQAKLRAAFEQFERRKLAEEWWANDPVAVLVRHHAEADLDSLAGMVGQRAEDLVKLLDLHPVLGIVVLGIAQEFFGIWGLLLAYPVTVFLILRVLGPKEERIQMQPGSP